MPNVFAEVVDQLDLDLAVERGSQRNDLLPPRDEDRTGGELGKRFSEALRSRMQRGKYDPVPAERILVPKPGNTTRPAALLTLGDRVVYDALVHAFRSRIESSLLGSGIVLWPRGEQSDKRWTEFEALPLELDGAFIARADVAAFYESVDHEILADTLIEATGRRDVVFALLEFLERTMGSNRGIPQGLDASDPLATAYLSPVDQAMLRGSLHYFRHGDDVRIVTETFAAARQALFEFEQELRRRKLVPSGEKSTILRRNRYAELCAEGRRVVEDTRKRLFASRAESLGEAPNEVQAILAKADKEELGWAFFYHGNISFEDLIAGIAEHLEPSGLDIAADLLDDAMGRPPHSEEGLSRDAFHYRVTTSLVRLAAARSPRALKHIRDLVRRYPEKTEIAANYLLALSEKRPKGVLRVCFSIIELPEFHTEWEIGWLLHVAYRLREAVSADQLAVLERLVDDEELWPSCRVSAARLVAASGRLHPQRLRRMWNVYSECHRPHLASAAFQAAQAGSEWADPFLEGVRNDPVIRVVLRHLGSDSA